MSNILIALAIGAVAGIIDVVPMIMQKMDKNACISAFLQWLFLGLIIPFVAWDLLPWLKGSIIALLMAIPIMIIVFTEDSKAIIPISVMSILLGAGVGYAGSILIG